MADRPTANEYSLKPPPTQHQHRVELGQDWTPATPSQMERLEQLEVQRAKFDGYYITEAKAAEIDPEVIATNPQLIDRIRYSQPDWPSGKASATKALGTLPGGCGESTDNRSVSFAQLTAGEVGPDGAD